MGRVAGKAALVVGAGGAEAAAARIRAAGGRAVASALDVRDRVAVDAAVAAVVLDVDAATRERIIAVNLTGMFHVGQAAARQWSSRVAGAASST